MRLLPICFLFKLILFTIFFFICLDGCLYFSLPCLSLPCLIPLLMPLFLCILPVSLPCLLLSPAFSLALPTSLPCLFPCPAFSLALPTSVPCLFPCPAFSLALPTSVPSYFLDLLIYFFFECKLHGYIASLSLLIAVVCIYVYYVPSSVDTLTFLLIFFIIIIKAVQISVQPRLLFTYITNIS